MSMMNMETHVFSSSSSCSNIQRTQIESMGLKMTNLVRVNYARNLKRRGAILQHSSRSRLILCSVAPPNQVQSPAPVTSERVAAAKVECFGVFCTTYNLKADEETKLWKKLINVSVSGAAGMISNHLLFKLASGEVFGQDQPIALKLLDSERSFQALEGVAMELEDSLYPLLRAVRIGIDPYEVFQDAEWALLIGAKPRGPGMECADLLDINGQIFAEQRGGVLIKKWGRSSAASTAVSIVDAIRSLVTPTPQGDWFSTGVYTNGSPYGIEEGIVFSMPCRSKGDGDYEFANDVIFDDFLWQRIKKSEAELLAERRCVAHLTSEGVYESNHNRR